MIRHILVLASAAMLLVLQAGPAHAAPLVGLVTGIVGAIKGSLLLTSLFKLAGSVVLSKLSAKLTQRKQRQPGIKTETTGTGAMNPCAFVLGRYATAGTLAAPPMSRTVSGSDVPNNELVYVIELGDVPGQTLEGLYVDGEFIDVATMTTAATLGYRDVTAGKFSGWMSFRYYDGTQTVADPYLLASYAGVGLARPWSADMVGRGICYVVLRFLYNRTLWSAFPQCRFVVGGIPLYDPRLDSTVGGSGAHRWADRATWAPSLNPMVMVYNIHRGVAVAGHVWGGSASADDLPVSQWFAAMNACDALVDNGAGGTEARFRAGYEVFVSEEPAGVCEELLKACLGQVADMGGRWVATVADAGLPVWSIDDDALVQTRAGDRAPFPAPQDTFNALAANYPEPAIGWEANPAPMVINATWQAEDGGQRRTATMDFPAVPFTAQVQRLMPATLAAERRFLTHGEVLPPEALMLDVLDAITWDSDSLGYGGKLFQIGRITESLTTGLISLQMRERDPADLAIPPGYLTPVSPVSQSGSVSGGAVASFKIGPADPVVVSAAITNAVTGWQTVLSSTIFNGPDFDEEVQFSALLDVTLTGAAAPKPLFWRLLISSAGFGSVEATVRTDYLLPGDLHRLTAAGSIRPLGPVTNMNLAVSGRGLAAGETITCTLAHLRGIVRNR